MIWILAAIFLTQNAAGQTTPLTSPLYPYGPSNGDALLETDTSLPVYLGYNVNFYGRKYNTAYITKNGFVSFDKDVTYQHFIYKDGARDHQHDYAFLAPFYFDGEAISNHYQGNIYYRLVFRNTSQEFLTQLQYYMLNATVGVEHFVPDVALVVTWEEVTDRSQIEDGRCQGTKSSPCKSSTFQLVLVACPMQTFAIFNYQKMDIPKKPFYQAGINGGHSVGWTSVCDSCKIADFPTLRGSDVRGRFIFRVSKNTIERGGCTDGSELQVLPQVAGMLGGEMLDISGPCMDGDVAIKCKFGSSDTVTSDGLKLNNMRLKCPVPKLTERGLIPLAVSIDGGINYKSHGNLFIVIPSKANKSLTLDKAWFQVTSDSLSMTWNPAVLSTESGVKVDINLIGYRETEQETKWKTLTTLGENKPNTGSFTFSPSDFQCHPSDCSLFEIGVVEVALQREFYPKANTRVVMSSGSPIGWYINDAMVEQHGDNWPVARCKEWYDADKRDMRWLDSLLSCPCNVEQAMVDFGRWQPDTGCSMFSKDSPTNCHYHQGAIHCVRSFQPTSTGAGNQCCYDKKGLLMYSADTYQGSTPDRSHSWGSYPYNAPGRVPSLSHWIKDVASFYYCCLWTNYDQCDYYMEQRPTRDCTGYEPSRSAFAYGDPHITTFDGKLYNFGGKGDYYLLKSTEFELQGQFVVGQQNHADGLSLNATVLTAVALNYVDKIVEIHLAPSGLNNGRKLDVFVDKKIKLFDSPATFKQDFGVVSIVNVVSDANDMGHDNFTVILQSGIGVQVAASNGLLHVIVNLPPNLKNKGAGLLGTWNDDVADDFTTKTGSVVDITATSQDVYNNFAKTWKVAEVESLFKHKETADDTFVPVFTPTVQEPSLSQLQSTCEDDAQCRFDYAVTANRDIAVASKNAGSWFAQIKIYQQKAESCGLLNVPLATKDNYNYTLGNVVTITDCRNGGPLSGETSYTCTKTNSDNLVWSPSVNAECSASPEQANIGMIIGIVVAVVAAIVIIIVIAVLSCRRASRRKTEKKGEPELEEGQKDPMMSDLKKKEEAADNE